MDLKFLTISSIYSHGTMNWQQWRSGGQINVASGTIPAGMLVRNLMTLYHLHNVEEQIF
jgi:hypothetical protein